MLKRLPVRSTRGHPRLADGRCHPKLSKSVEGPHNTRVLRSPVQLARRNWIHTLKPRWIATEVVNALDAFAQRAGRRRAG